MNIGIEKTTEVADVLQKVLANQHILYQKLRKFHWNVTGEHFLTLHEFFEESYTDLTEDIDVIAERIRSLDIFAKGTMSEYLDIAELKETKEQLNAQEMIFTLLSDYETLIRLSRSSADECADLNDKGNEDILVGLIEKYEKTAWMLRSMKE